MPYERSGGKQCVVVGCHNNQKKLYLWKNSMCDEHAEKQEDCPCLTPFNFHCIPKDAERRRLWLRAINRKGFDPRGKELVCSIHFVDGKPTEQNPCPTQLLGYENKVKLGRRKVMRTSPVNMETNTDSAEVFDESLSEMPGTSTPMCTKDSIEPLSKEISCQTEPVSCCCCGKANSKFTTQDASTQTQDFVAIDHCYQALKSPRVNVSTQHSSEFGADYINNETSSKFYTGLTLATFLCLLKTLTPLGDNLSSRMPVPDQIFLTVIRLRLGLAFEDLGHRFGISTQLANKIFHVWINIMSDSLKDCVLWLPRETIKRNMPSSFREQFPNTTCIIDCTEVFIHRPFSLKARAQTYSTYKGHNTAKLLVAIAPNGYIMFVSKSYGGRASDNFITKDSGFLDHLRPGDEVMADRGFTIAEDLFARRVKLNIPAFMKGRKQLSEKDAIETRRIASVRIHVERAIARLKNYRILNTTVSVRSLKKFDKIVKVCSALCNMQGPLIKQDALY